MDDADPRLEASAQSLYHPVRGTLSSAVTKTPFPQKFGHAPNSAFETKDLLKGPAYQWDGIRKTWHRTVTGTEAITGEVAWLRESIYGGRNVKLEFEVRDALLRYSRRPGKKFVKEI